jgi:hypothetical protein
VKKSFWSAFFIVNPVYNLTNVNLINKLTYISNQSNPNFKIFYLFQRGAAGDQERKGVLKESIKTACRDRQSGYNGGGLTAMRFCDEKKEG